MLNYTSKVLIAYAVFHTVSFNQIVCRINLKWCNLAKIPFLHNFYIKWNISKQKCNKTINCSVISGNQSISSKLRTRVELRHKTLNGRQAKALFHLSVLDRSLLNINKNIINCPLTIAKKA